MNKTLVAGLAIWMGVIFASVVRAEEQPWQLRAKKDNISVYTRKVPGFAILEFRSDVRVSASMDQVVALFEDAQRTPEWYYQCVHMALVQEEDPLRRVFYFVIHLPWPVAERDAVFRRSKSVDAATGALTYELTALPDRVPKEKGKIRIPYLKSVWRFTPLKEGQTEIYFQQLSDAGGSIPAFITNALVLDIPLNSLKKFRDLVQGQK